MESSTDHERHGIQAVEELSRAIHGIVTLARERISADEDTSTRLLVDVAKQSVAESVTCLLFLRSELIRADGRAESLSIQMNYQSNRHREWKRIQSSPAAKDEQILKKTREKVEEHGAAIAAIKEPLALACAEAELLQAVDRAVSNEIVALERLASQMTKEAVEPVDSQARVDAWREALLQRLIETHGAVEQFVSAAYNGQLHSQK